MAYIQIETISKKKCKGQNKAFGFDSCEKMVDTNTRKYGLCQTCYWEWMQTNESGKIHYQKQFMPKVKRKVETDKKKRTKEEREALKSIARLIQDARIPFQQWIRIRDLNDACISCGCVNAKVWHGGIISKQKYTQD